MQTTTSEIKLRYYYDPLCGWCYGFSPVMAKVQAAYGDQLAIEVISGGLFLGNRAGLINQVAPHIKAGAYRSVEARTGVKFGKRFLEDVFGDGQLVLNSLPPTIALNIVREKYPERALEFASSLLQTVYADGFAPTDVDALATCAAKVGYDKDVFKAKMNEASYQQAALQEFEQFKASPYAAMPALVLMKAGKEYPISRGFTDFDHLQSSLNAALAAGGHH